MRDKLRKLGAKLRKLIPRRKPSELDELQVKYNKLRSDVSLLSKEMGDVLKKNPSLSDRGRYNN
jgi:hypothetical protein